MNIISLIIWREFVSKVRNKAFIIMTFVSPMIFVAITLIINYLSTVPQGKKIIAIHDESQMFIKDFVAKNKKDTEYKYYDLTGIDLKFLKDSIVSNRYDGLIYIPKVYNIKDLQSKIEFISNEAPSIFYISNIQNIVEKILTKENYRLSNLDTLAITNAQSKVTIELVKTSGEKSAKGLNEIKIGIGGAFGYLIMMFIIIYGNMVMRSVIEEKTNRIIEIIISSVKPFQLMMGKIVGTLMAGLLQFMIWVVVGFSLMALITYYVDAATLSVGKTPINGMASSQTETLQIVQLYLQELWRLPIATILICFVTYFVGGYLLYSSFYASIGAAVDSETDTQQFMFPVIIPLVLAVYIGFFTVVNEPHGTIATVFSMIPLTSPIVMMMRIPFGVPWWQIMISIFVLFLSFIAVVSLAAKIYKVGILMFGKKPSWKELYKWSKA